LLRVPFVGVSLYGRVADLSLEIESYDLEPLEHAVSPEFKRRTTVVRLRGEGHEGIGEDVTYSADDQEGLQTEGPALPLGGSHSLDSFSQLLDRLALWPAGPAIEQFRPYRRWAFESAALDLALRQAGAPLHDVIGLEPLPVTFVSSMRLGEPASMEPLKPWLDAYPKLRLKLDPTSTWDDRLVTSLVETGAVDTLDLKGAYKGTPVDQEPDPTLYARVATAFPDSWIEDPALTEETDPVLEPHRARITWDAPIHSIGDIEALPFRPRTLNFKPSRFGSLRALLDAYDYCTEHQIGIYGGGQFELGPGRGQIQYLASLFHPDMPNDVAPRAYNDNAPSPGLPSSPLPPAPSETGFRWGE
jgi:L-alanine-DL-glutamate epimerase-like enolase superfamily enzyme